MNAIGSPDNLPIHIRRAFEPEDDFNPLPPPGPADWLSHHKELGQTYDEYVRSRPLMPDTNRNRIYIQPIGHFTEGKSPSLETGHMFGLHHCIFYACFMNGSNHLEESDARPIHLCPVCLKKLYHCIRFDIVGRYQGLLKFYEKKGLQKEALWMNKRLKRIIK